MRTLKEDLIVEKIASDDHRNGRYFKKTPYILRKGAKVHFRKKYNNKDKKTEAGLWIYASRLDFSRSKSYDEYKDAVYSANITIDDFLDRTEV